MHPRDIDKTQQAEIRESGIQSNQQDSEESNLLKKDLKKIMKMKFKMLKYLIQISFHRQLESFLLLSPIQR